MKFLGLNILTDNQLQQIADNHWEKTRKLLKLKKAYEICRRIIKMPKCNNCDENRKITVTLPDGSTREINCSCNKERYEHFASEVKKLSFLVQEDGQICIISTSKMYRDTIQRIKLLSTKEEVKSAFDSWRWDSLLFDTFFATKDLAEYGAKLLEEREKQRNKQQI